jgi:hypothetical protein
MLVRDFVSDWISGLTVKVEVNNRRVEATFSTCLMASDSSETGRGELGYRVEKGLNIVDGAISSHFRLEGEKPFHGPLWQRRLVSPGGRSCV